MKRHRLQMQLFNQWHACQSKSGPAAGSNSGRCPSGPDWACSLLIWQSSCRACSVKELPSASSLNANGHAKLSLSAPMCRQSLTHQMSSCWAHNLISCSQQAPQCQRLRQAGGLSSQCRGWGRSVRLYGASRHTVQYEEVKDWAVCT